MSSTVSPESSPENATPQPKGRSAKRSRRGCWTCRGPGVKKRCDERRPVCGRCAKTNSYCDYAPRPPLRERRRAQESANLEDIPEFGLEICNRALSGARRPSLSSIRIAAPATGACSLLLSGEDHEAIRFFRTAFAKFHHTKNPDYSLFSIMFTIAQDDPMAMHMVILLGLKEMDLRRPNTEGLKKRDPREHYASALRLMADAISPGNESHDIDAIYTTLWLMLLYEQQFDDSQCKHYSQHLAGVCGLLQHRGDEFSQLPLSSTAPASKVPVLARRSQGHQPRLSIYSARILVWICLLDAGAASSGINCGGQVNGTLFSLLTSDAKSRRHPTTPVETFSRLHKYSNPLYRLTWGDAYPQAELLDDVENRNVYALLGQCAQLRFMTAQLASLYRKDPQQAAYKAQGVEDSIQQVGDTFAELIEVASELSPKTDNSTRLVANIRAIVPMYHAVVLDFMRLIASERPLVDRQRHALREIMNTAYQSFKHDGDDAMVRVAWPLFMVALETDDHLHRDWVLDRFAAISKYGKNFERAHRFLRETIPVQQQLGKKIDLRARLAQGEQFVLS